MWLDWIHEAFDKTICVAVGKQCQAEQTSRVQTWDTSVTQWRASMDRAPAGLINYNNIRTLPQFKTNIIFSMCQIHIEYYLGH